MAGGSFTHSDFICDISKSKSRDLESFLPCCSGYTETTAQASFLDGKTCMTQLISVASS